MHRSGSIYDIWAKPSLVPRREQNKQKVNTKENTEHCQKFGLIVHEYYQP